MKTVKFRKKFASLSEFIYNDARVAKSAGHFDKKSYVCSYLLWQSLSEKGYFLPLL